MKPETVDLIRQHAARDYPRESCGVVAVIKGKERYVECRNIAEVNDHFIIEPEDYAAVEDVGAVLKIVHSHPNIAALPSQADLVGCEKSGLPWVIVNWPTGVIHEFEPTGYRAPLIGREFQHGVLDCYSLISDYYLQVLGVAIPDFDRADEWWLKGQNLYLENFERAGFIEVHDYRQHDGLLMQVGSPVPNHGAIYLGDGCIMHHQSGRLSSRDVFGGWYQKCTVKIVRHRSLA